MCVPTNPRVGDLKKMSRANGGLSQAQVAGQDKAERVLTQIRQKLGPELSVEYRVNQLVQDARNEDHLSRIFIGELPELGRELTSGWQSWL